MLSARAVPPGTSAEDLYAAPGILRAACWAAAIRVTRDQQRPHIVTVDVIRRPGDAGLAAPAKRRAMSKERTTSAIRERPEPAG
jgi:hypothetical protein